MKKALHLTVAGRSTGIVLVTDQENISRLTDALAQISFADLPPLDSYETFFVDAFFVNSSVTVARIEDYEIK